jgi:hypothetical protein
MKSHEYKGVIYTVRKDGEWFYAAFRDIRGAIVRVQASLKRIAVASIKAHIDDQVEESKAQPQ